MLIALPKSSIAQNIFSSSNVFEMATPRLDRDRAAKILLDALSMGDDAAAKKWGIAPRTIGRYRSMIDNDRELAEAIADKKSQQNQEWASEIPSMLQAGMEFLKRAATEADCRDPQVIYAIAGAVKLCAEIQAMRELINVRIKQ
jgi:hypothetical protein